ncbi:uncharacterized protein CIMG_09138 [Coccidioides immitis RS]|uniref:Uncharacterized protein n=3 Tax=Coccidioides immitis TaxID=5501 RepID=A0A0E1S091_COCIM|nr:uncharacterized protein CIMG_09138 [Coccidioides immitis RS]EAS27934.1 hypothetical protein CIMG_09138 [Coccidioides immitis RS]KMP08734.1 hypothetical protein CIRG_08415 [Coccidioides immitis RMSCC 2394]KMU78725.1 hypothetical protein CISG_01765 [Coccidioides immitis RMSCC 3703]
MPRFFPARTCLILLVLFALAHGGPVGAPAGGSPGNGPLGSSPGGPQGPVPVGAGGDSDGAKPAANPFQNLYRGVNTTLAILSAVLMTMTYAVLIGPGTRLSSTSKIPLGAIRTNIGNLLSRTWPDMSTSSDTTATGKSVKSTDGDSIRLFYVGKLDNDGGDGRTARGIEDCEGLPKTRIQTPPMWLTAGSSLTKSIVQVAIWEWVCLWMVLAMIIATLMYNGFLTKQKTPDAYPRLVVAIIYFTAFGIHAWYVWKTCRSFFTLLGAGATWSLLNKASFSSVDLGQLKAGISGGTPPVFRKIGKPDTSPNFPPYENCRLKETRALKSADPTETSATPAEEDEGAVNTVTRWQKQEISSTVQAASVALERVITNVVSIVGITITTGFATWTTISDGGDSTTQLGSLALLASLTIGSGAMFSSAIELSVMETSFRNVLFYKEVLINRQATAHVQKRAKKKDVVGFTHNTVDMKTVGVLELARFTKLWALIIFGPAYALLPSEEDHFRQSVGADFEVCSAVRDKQVLLTTAATTERQAHTDDGNFESINVCFLANRDWRSPGSATSLETTEPHVLSKTV